MSSSKFILDPKYGSLLTTLGISVSEVLKKSDLPQDILNRKVSLMTIDEYTRFLDAIKELSDDKILPLKIGTIENIETFSPPVFASYCSKNALMCFKRLSKYKKLVGPLIFLVTEDKDSVCLELMLEDDTKKLPEYLVAIEMVFLLQLIRNATKKNIVPIEIISEYKLDDEKYIEFFGIKPNIGVRNILTISKEDALTPFISENISMWEYFEPELKRRLSELEVEDTYSARVRSALIELLPVGEGSIEEVSRKLGSSKRTLQRKLKEEDTTFQKQLNHTRELLARHYLKNTDLTSDEIAYLIGYQDLNSFVRAFHIWTGMTISDYKKNT